MSLLLDPMFQARLQKPRLPQISQSIKERITLLPWNDKCPAVQLIFLLGEEELVFVDLVPALQGTVVLSEDWCARDLARLSDWWCEKPGNEQQRFRQKQAQVARSGADLVAKDGFWRFSFANAETNFLKFIDIDGGQQRKALKLLKFINKERWVQEYGKILTSYHLKTVLLWALEIQPEKEKWETLASSLLTLLHILHYCLKNERLPHYFLRNFNLFNKRYKVGNGLYERLALQVLTKEVQLMAVDPVGYISLRFFSKVAEQPQDFSSMEASLREFKETHQEGLKALKNLDEEQLYELEEDQHSDKNVSNPDQPLQNLMPQNLDTVLAEYKQFQGKSHQCQGKAKEPVKAPSTPVTFSPDLDQVLQNPILPQQTNTATPLVFDYMEGTEYSRLKWKCTNFMKQLAQIQTNIIFLSKCKQLDIIPNGLKSHKINPMKHVAKSSPGDKVASAAFPEKENLILDPDTAHPLLEISADGKEVKCGSFMKTLSTTSSRFDMANCVVAKQSFSDGQHYWEVSVGWKPRWNLGIVSAQAVRQGRLIQKKSWWPWSEKVCAEGYWMIGYDQQKDGKKYWAFDTNPMPIDCSPHPQTIGVYLNYLGRELTFYNAEDPNNLIFLYSFYNVAFNRLPVYPFFDPCYHDNGRNVEILKIL